MAAAVLFLSAAGLTGPARRASAQRGDHPWRDEVDEGAQLGRDLAAGRPEQEEPRAAFAEGVEDADQASFAQRLADREVRQAGDARVAQGEADAGLERLASVPLLYEPGRAWGYSLATDVLGALVERVDGRPLAEALRQRVGIPAGMRDSGFLCADACRLAAVYVSDRPRPRRMAGRETVAPFEDSVGIRFEPSRAFEPSAYASGGAGMIGSAGDVLRLLEVLRQGGAPLLTPGLVEEMGRDQVPGMELPANPGFGFGLGFSVLRDPAIAQSPEAPGTWRCSPWRRWRCAWAHAFRVGPRDFPRASSERRKAAE